MHATSGRVIRTWKGDLPAIRIEPDSLADFMSDFAAALWNDRYRIMGDPAHDRVEEAGLISLEIYVRRTGV